MKKGDVISSFCDFDNSDLPEIVNDSKDEYDLQNLSSILYNGSKGRNLGNNSADPPNLRTVLKNTSNDVFLSEEMERMLTIKHDKAIQYFKIRNSNKAISYFKEILSFLIQEYGEIHSRVGSAHYNLGIAYSRVENFDDALGSMEKAVQVQKVTINKMSSKLADSLVELGTIHVSLENFEESIESLNQALEIREHEASIAVTERQREKIHLQIAKVLNNIGCVYLEYGDLEYAIETYEEALELQRRILGNKEYETQPGYLGMASTICNVGYIHLQRNNWEDAITYLEEALEIQRSILKLGDKVTINTLENLAFALTMFGNHDQALKLYKDILWNNNNKLVSTETMKWLAYNHTKLCQYDKTLEYLEKVERILEDELDPENSQLEEIRKHIVSVHYQIHKFPGPLELISRSLISSGMRNPLDNTLCQCVCAEPELGDMDITRCVPMRPQVKAKMMGQKLSYA